MQEAVVGSEWGLMQFLRLLALEISNHSRGVKAGSVPEGAVAPHWAGHRAGGFELGGVSASHHFPKSLSRTGLQDKYPHL